MNNRHSEQGTALIGAVLIIVILSLLATVSLTVAAQELESIAAAREAAAARHLAEAGADLVVQWLHDPSALPAGPPRSLFTKREVGPDGSPSFFNSAGQSQFVGTRDRPDVLYDAARPSDDRLLNDPSTGWFRALRTVGRITRLAVYAPSRPGLLCTVEVTAETRRVTRTVAVQLGVKSWPAIRAGAQIGVNGPVSAATTPLPVSVHWGDLVINGNARLGAVRDLPARNERAAVTGTAYADMAIREDPWFEVFLGGEALFEPSPTGPATVPANVHAQQEPAPGLRLDRWDFQALKETALRDGTYYVLGPDGLLYRHGRIETGRGVAPVEVFQSTVVGDHRGVVFVDTPNQVPPSTENMGTLTLDAEYMEGVFVVNAHVRFAPAGPGRTVAVRNPLSDGQRPDEVQPPISLTSINLRGVLVTPGNLMLEGPSRLYGAVIVGGSVLKASEADAQLEVWFDRDLERGLVPGAPLVYQALGTWQEKYEGKRTL